MNDCPVIETIGLVRRLGGRAVLDGLDLTVPAGGVHAIVGRNGAGKSTLYRVLLGFLAPSAGSARLLGEDVERLSPATRRRVGFVHEAHPLPSWMDVASLIAMQRHHAGRWSEATFDAVAGRFALSRGQSVASLSRGERAGLALALAMAPQPELLLLDEPTLGLDLPASRAFLDALLFAAEQGPATVVLSTHQVDAVERLAERVTVLEGGRALLTDAPEAIAARVDAWIVEPWPDEIAPATLPGVLACRRLEAGCELLVLDQGAGFASVLGAMGASGARRARLGFERALAALLEPRPFAAKDLATWQGDDRCSS